MSIRKDIEELVMKQGTVAESDDDLVSQADLKHSTPEGLFTKSADEIVDGLLSDASGDEELALKRINYYINRAGDGLSNKTAVHAAKKTLQKKADKAKEEKVLQIDDDVVGLDSVLEECDDVKLKAFYERVYDTMFEAPEEDDNKPKLAGKKKTVRFLLNNDINPYWFIERRPLQTEPGKFVIIRSFTPSGNLLIQKYKDWDAPLEEITPEQYRDMIDSELNSDMVSEFEIHHKDVDTLKQDVEYAQKMWQQKIEYFYNEHKDELGLKSPNSLATRRAFKQFWDELSNIEKRAYGTSFDIRGISTMVPNRGSAWGIERQKASPRRLNSPVTQTTYARPADFVPREEKPKDVKNAEFLSSVGIDPKYIKEPILDQYGSEWIVTDFDDRDKSKSPAVKLTSTNPNFKQSIQLPAEELKVMIQKYNTPKESSEVEEAYNPYRPIKTAYEKQASQKSITQGKAVREYLIQKNINPEFMVSPLHDRQGRRWVITGYNDSGDEEKLLIKRYEGSLDGTKNVSNKVDIDVVKRWIEKIPENANPHQDETELYSTAYLFKQPRTRGLDNQDKKKSYPKDTLSGILAPFNYRKRNNG